MTTWPILATSKCDASLSFPSFTFPLFPHTIRLQEATRIGQGAKSGFSVWRCRSHLCRWCRPYWIFYDTTLATLRLLVEGDWTFVSLFQTRSGKEHNAETISIDGDNLDRPWEKPSWLFVVFLLYLFSPFIPHTQKTARTCKGPRGQFVSTAMCLLLTSNCYGVLPRTIPIWGAPPSSPHSSGFFHQTQVCHRKRQALRIRLYYIDKAPNSNMTRSCFPWRGTANCARKITSWDSSFYYLLNQVPTWWFVVYAGCVRRKAFHHSYQKAPTGVRSPLGCEGRLDGNDR